MKALNLILFASLFLFCGCEDDDDSTPRLVYDCGSPIEILPESLWSPGPDLTGARVESIEGTCVVINYTRVGCSDQGLPLRLFTEGQVAESFPTQTSAQLRFSTLDGVDACAIFTNQRDTFDLAPYIAGGQPTLLTLLGADTTLLIE